MPAATTGTRRLTVILTAEVSKFTQGLVAAQKQLESTSRRMIAIGQNLAFSIGAPLAAVGASTVKLAADFENAGDMIVTQTRLARKDVDALRQTVVEMSDNLGIDQIQLMEGALAVTSAGMSDAAQTAEVLKLSAMGSAIGLGEIGQVARATVAIMKAYADSNTTAQEAVNSLVLAVKAGNFPAQQWAETVSLVAGNAQLLGISLLEVTAAISTYSQVTGDAVIATIGISNILADLAKPSAKAKELWESLFKEKGGILEARRLVQQDLIGFLVQLAQKLNELPKEEAAELANIWFDNIRASRAFLTTFGALGEDVIAIHDEMIREASSLQKAWNAILDSASRVWGHIRTSVLNLAVAIGEQFLPILKEIGFQFAAWLTVLRPVIVANAKLIAGISLAVIGFIALTVALGSVLLLIASVTGAFILLKIAAVATAAVIASAFAFIGGPFAALGLALVALGVAVSDFGEKSAIAAAHSASTWEKLWGMAFLGMKVLARDFVAFLSRMIGSLFGMLSAAFAQAAPTAGVIFGPFFEAIAAAFGDIQKVTQQGAEDWERHTEKLSFELKSSFNQMIAGIFEEAEAQVPELLLRPEIKIEPIVEPFSLEGILGIKPEQAITIPLRLEPGAITSVDTLKQSVASLIEKWRTGELTFDNLMEKFKRLAGIDMGKLALPVDEKEAKALAEGLQKINDMFFEQSQKLEQVRRGWTDFEVETMAGTREIQKIAKEIKLTDQQTADFVRRWEQLRATLDKELGASESLRDLAQAVREANEKLADLRMEGTETFKELQQALQKFEAVDLTQMTDAQIATFRRLKLQIFDVYADIEKETQKVTIDIKEAFLSAVDQVTRGILQGTRDWRDYLEIFADIGIGIISDFFQGMLRDKLKNFDPKIEANFLKTLPDMLESFGSKIAQFFGWEEAVDPLQEAIQKIREELAQASGAVELDPLQAAIQQIREELGEVSAGGAMDPLQKAIQQIREELGEVGIDQVTQDLKSGTREWERSLEVFGAEGAAIIQDCFGSFSKAKAAFDAEFKKNFEKTLPAMMDPLQAAIEQFRLEELMAGADPLARAISDIRKELEAVGQVDLDTTLDPLQAAIQKIRGELEGLTETVQLPPIEAPELKGAKAPTPPSLDTSVFTDLYDAASGLVLGIADLVGLSGTFKTILRVSQVFFQGLSNLDALSGSLPGIYAKVRDFFVGLLDLGGLSTGLQSIVANVRDFLLDLVDLENLTEGLSYVYEKVRDFLLGLVDLDALSQGLQSVYASVRDWLLDLIDLDSLTSGLQNVLGQVRDFFGGLLDASGLADDLQFAVTAVKGFFQDLVDTEALQANAAALRDWFLELVGATEPAAALQSSAGIVENFFREVVDSVPTEREFSGGISVLTGFYVELSEAAEPPAGLFGAVDRVREFFAGLLDAGRLTEGLQAILQRVQEFFAGLLDLEGLADGLRSLAGRVGDFFRELAGAIDLGPLRRAATGLGETFRGMVDSIARGTGGLAEAATTAGGLPPVEPVPAARTPGSIFGGETATRAVLEAIRDFAEKMLEELQYLGDVLLDLGGSLQAALEDMWSALSREVQEVARKVDRLQEWIQARAKFQDDMARKQAIIAGIGGIARGVAGIIAAGQGGGAGAEGGITRGATRMLIGEAGPEALIPLSHMDDMFRGETTVVVNSPHPATVRRSETPDERRIEVIIDDVIARSFRTGGKASQAAERNFGLRRQGGTR